MVPSWRRQSTNFGRWRSQLRRRQRIVSLILWFATVLVSSYLLFFVTGQFGFLGYTVAGAIYLVEYSLTDRLVERILGKEVPMLSFEPLELTPATKFNPIQFMTLVWSSGTKRAEEGKIVENTVTQTTLELRFGMIRVRNKGSDAQNCRVSLRLRARPINTDEWIWVEEGNLSWYSASKRKNISEASPHDFDLGLLGMLLGNTTEDIHTEEVKYLQVGFFNKRGPGLFLCTDTRTYPSLSIWEIPDYLKLADANNPDLTIRRYWKRR